MAVALQSTTFRAETAKGRGFKVLDFNDSHMTLSTRGPRCRRGHTIGHDRRKFAVQRLRRDLNSRSAGRVTVSSYEAACRAHVCWHGLALLTFGVEAAVMVVGWRN